MLTNYVRALGQLFDPRVVRLVGWSILLSLLVFAGLLFAVHWLLTNSALTSMAIVEQVIDWFGRIATVVSAFFLFPMAISALLGLFLDAVARAVEARHYPDLPPAPGVSLFAGLMATLRFLAKALLVNLCLLVLVLVPILTPLYPAAWLAAHAYLLGREYFELVALRRVDATTAQVLRRRHRLGLLLGGLGAMALFAIPVVNMIAPVVATMAMVHAFERWRPRGELGRSTQPAGGG